MALVDEYRSARHREGVARLRRVLALRAMVATGRVKRVVLGEGRKAVIGPAFQLSGERQPLRVDPRECLLPKRVGLSFADSYSFSTGRRLQASLLQGASASLARAELLPPHCPFLARAANFTASSAARNRACALLTLSRCS